MKLTAWLGAAISMLATASVPPQRMSDAVGPDRALSARDSALHVLERFAYGPRAGQVDQVANEGALDAVFPGHAVAPDKFLGALRG